MGDVFRNPIGNHNTVTLYKNAITIMTCRMQCIPQAGRTTRHGIAEAEAGQMRCLMRENQVFFDEELESLFDPKTKEVIKALFRSK